MLKYYITFLFGQFTKTLNHFFFFFFFDLGQTEISKLVSLFHLSNSKHSGSSKVLSLDNILPNGHGLYNATDHVRIKSTTCSHTVF